MEKTIAMLRFALASIWTELERDDPDVYGCQGIADDALNMSVQYAPKGKVPSNLIGVEGWNEKKTTI